MLIAITGGTGYVGRHIVAALRARGDAVVVISRSANSPWPDPGVRVVPGDPTRPGAWQAAVAGADAVLNLAGERIVDPPKRWTARRKRALIDSRVNTTRNVAAAIRTASAPPRVLLSASASGYYGDTGGRPIDEFAPAGDDFLSQLALEWESAAQEAASATRVVRLRTAPIIAADAPAVRPMLPFFKWGLGAWWGGADLWWPWVHIADVVGLALFLLDRGDLEGAFNVTAPQPVTVKNFANALGRALHRPVLLHIPGPLLRLALGEAADALLHLQRLRPARALAAGYGFRFGELEGALAAELG